MKTLKTLLLAAVLLRLLIILGFMQQTEFSMRESTGLTWMSFRTAASIGPIWT